MGDAALLRRATSLGLVLGQKQALFIRRSGSLFCRSSLSIQTESRSLALAKDCLCEICVFYKLRWQ
jgi:hypothetical protein